MKTNIYVDGFNLYYGVLKKTSKSNQQRSYKWLDIDALIKNKYPQNNIQKIKYFTAHVNARPDDPRRPNRQQIYLRALRTFEHIEIILGHFLTNKVRMMLVNPPSSGPSTAEVWKTEEKGSDVNLAVHLLNDAYKKEYEVAIVVSNDSDLAEAVRIVTQTLKLRVGILFPIANHRQKSYTLKKYATFEGMITRQLLACSLLPETLKDASGTFSKPRTW